MEASSARTIDRGVATGRSRHVLLLAALVLAALLPRVAMSHLRPVLCTDAVFFLERAAAFERGDYKVGLSRLGLNPYPFVLAQLHSAGLDWELAGRWWSLVLASLAVLPLYGLTRRFFGAVAAIVACLLYAVQPELIEWSPEIIRDPTFWFLLLAALYYSHVAAAADRHATLLHTIAGTCIALAGLIRFEGWFLVVPLVWWTIAYRRPTRGYLTATARLSIAGAMTPLWLVAINVVFLAGHERWEWGRFDHLVMALHWTTGDVSIVVPNDAASPTSTTSYAPEDASKRPSLKVMCWGMAHTFVRGVHPIYLLAMGAGLWVARRRNFLLDQFPLWLLAAMNLGAVWIYFWSHHEITSRYMLLVVLVGLPYAGLSIVWVAGQLARLGRSEKFARIGVRSICAAIVAVVAAIGCFDALTSEYQSRHMKANLGRWILARYGAERAVLCSENLERLVGYYAAARHTSISSDASAAEALARVDTVEPDIVTLWMKQPSEQAVLAHYQQSTAGEFDIYRSDQLPQGCHDVAVLVRANVAVGQKPAVSAATGVSLSDRARPLY